MCSGRNTKKLIPEFSGFPPIHIFPLLKSVLCNNTVPGV